MSEESAYVLQVVHDELEKCGREIVGPLELTGDVLAAFDGQMLLKAEIRCDPGYHPSIAHCHVIARIGNASWSDPLDACVMGTDPDRRHGLAKAAQNWVSNVGSPLFSLLHAGPVMDATHFEGNDPWGVPGCHGFVGPLYGYNMKELKDPSPIFKAGIFDYVAAMAPPGMVHLAKVVLDAKGVGGWNRTLEIDGHLANFEEKQWNCGIPAPQVGIISQFAVFHHGGDKEAVESRRRIDEAIRQFVAEVARTKSVDAATQMLGEGGFDPDVIHRIASFAPLAFCRVVFGDIGVKYSTEFKWITKEGTCQTLKYMREPAFARSLVLMRDLFDAGFGEAVKGLAMYSSTFNVVSQALNSGSKPQDLLISPAIIPDRDADAAAVERAVTPTPAPTGTKGTTRPPRRARTVSSIWGKCP
ncbi:MAG TPA: hypothetical protein VG269_29010 [Tepidisphaeraceae bacterium]|jgi:hypothetical protein|nr:hypothetical protein [Tepidisphaeraceae bacterium]